MEPVSDFVFYLKFTRPLILNLPQTKDRALAAAWVKKLTDDATADDALKLDYIKLLLFVLQRKQLVAPFTQHPNEIDTILPFDDGHDLVRVAQRILEKDAADRRAARQAGDYPPYICDFSADLLEYCAMQEITSFGVHGYYAISKNPLNNWHRVDTTILPKAAKSLAEVSPQPATITGTRSSPDLPADTPSKGRRVTISEEPVEPPDPVLADIAPEPAAEPVVTPKRRKPRSPMRPIGKITEPPAELDPPSWGSPLLEIKGVVVGPTIDLPHPEMETLWTSPSAREPSPRGSSPWGDSQQMEAFDLPYLTPPIPSVTPPPPSPPPRTPPRPIRPPRPLTPPPTPIGKRSQAVPSAGGLTPPKVSKKLAQLYGRTDIDQAGLDVSTDLSQDPEVSGVLGAGAANAVHLQAVALPDKKKPKKSKLVEPKAGRIKTRMPRRDVPSAVEMRRMPLDTGIKRRPSGSSIGSGRSAGSSVTVLDARPSTSGTQTPRASGIPTPGGTVVLSARAAGKKPPMAFGSRIATPVARPEGPSAIEMRRQPLNTGLRNPPSREGLLPKKRPQLVLPDVLKLRALGRDVYQDPGEWGDKLRPEVKKGIPKATSKSKLPSSVSKSKIPGAAAPKTGGAVPKTGAPAGAKGKAFSVPKGKGKPKSSDTSLASKKSKPDVKKSKTSLKGKGKPKTKQAPPPPPAEEEKKPRERKPLKRPSMLKKKGAKKAVKPKTPEQIAAEAEEEEEIDFTEFGITKEQLADLDVNLDDLDLDIDAISDDVVELEEVEVLADADDQAEYDRRQRIIEQLEAEFADEMDEFGDESMDEEIDPERVKELLGIDLSELGIELAVKPPKSAAAKSKIAKTLTKGKTPKLKQKHDSPVKLDKSIHMTEEAKDIVRSGMQMVGATEEEDEEDEFAARPGETQEEELRRLTAIFDRQQAQLMGTVYEEGQETDGQRLDRLMRELREEAALADAEEAAEAQGLSPRRSPSPHRTSPPPQRRSPSPQRRSPSPERASASVDKNQSLSASFNELAAVAVQSPLYQQPDEEFEDSYEAYLAEQNALMQLQNAYEELKPDHPDDLEHTPPMFSSHRKVREAARPLKWRPDETGIEPDEQFQPADKYFASSTKKWSPKLQHRTLRPTQIFPGLEMSMVNLDEEELPASPLEHLDDSHEIRERVDTLTHSGVGLYGVPCTSPKPSISPKRPIDTFGVLDYTPPPEFFADSDMSGLFGEDLEDAVPLQGRTQIPRTPPRAGSPLPSPIIDPALVFDYQETIPEGMTLTPKGNLKHSPPYGLGYHTPPELRHSEAVQPVSSDFYDPTQVSPARPHWRDRYDEIRRKLFGEPEDDSIFAETFAVTDNLMAASPPGELDLQERENMEPDYEMEAGAEILQLPLKRHDPREVTPIPGERIRTPVRGRTSPQMSTVTEELEELSPSEVAAIRSGATPPTGRKRTRSARPPQLAPIAERFDVSHEMSPPGTPYVSPNADFNVSRPDFYELIESPIAREEFYQSIRQHSAAEYEEPYRRRFGKRVVNRYSRPPQIGGPIKEYGEDMHEDDQEELRQIQAAPPLTYKKYIRGTVNLYGNRKRDYWNPRDPLPTILEPGATPPPPMPSPTGRRDLGWRPRRLDFDAQDPRYTTEFPPELLPQPIPEETPRPLRRMLKKRVLHFTVPGEPNEEKCLTEDYAVDLDEMFGDEPESYYEEVTPSPPLYREREPPVQDMETPEISPSAYGYKTPSPSPGRIHTMHAFRDEMAAFKKPRAAIAKRFPKRAVPVSPQVPHRGVPTMRTNVPQRYSKAQQGLTAVPELQFAEQVAARMQAEEGAAMRDLRSKRGLLDTSLSPIRQLSPLTPRRDTRFVYSTPPGLSQGRVHPTPRTPEAVRPDPPSFGSVSPQLVSPARSPSLRSPSLRSTPRGAPSGGESLEATAQQLVASPLAGAPTAAEVHQLSALQQRQLGSTSPYEPRRGAPARDDDLDEFEALEREMESPDAVKLTVQAADAQGRDLDVHYRQEVQGEDEESALQNDGYDEESLSKLGFTLRQIQDLASGKKVVTKRPCTPALARRALAAATPDSPDHMTEMYAKITRAESGERRPIKVGKREIHRRSDAGVAEMAREPLFEDAEMFAEQEQRPSFERKASPRSPMLPSPPKVEWDIDWSMSPEARAQYRAADVIASPPAYQDTFPIQTHAIQSPGHSPQALIGSPVSPTAYIQAHTPPRSPDAFPAFMTPTPARRAPPTPEWAPARRSSDSPQSPFRAEQLPSPEPLGESRRSPPASPNMEKFYGGLEVLAKGSPAFQQAAPQEQSPVMLSAEEVIPEEEEEEDDDNEYDPGEMNFRWMD